MNLQWTLNNLETQDNKWSKQMSFWGWGLPISDPFLTTTSFIHSGWAVWESWGLLDWWRGALG